MAVVDCPRLCSTTVVCVSGLTFLMVWRRPCPALLLPLLPPALGVIGASGLAVLTHWAAGHWFRCQLDPDVIGASGRGWSTQWAPGQSSSLRGPRPHSMKLESMGPHWASAILCLVHLPRDDSPFSWCWAPRVCSAAPAPLVRLRQVVDHSSCCCATVWQLPLPRVLSP